MCVKTFYISLFYRTIEEDHNHHQWWRLILEDNWEDGDEDDNDSNLSLISFTFFNASAIPEDWRKKFLCYVHILSRVRGGIPNLLYSKRMMMDDSIMRFFWLFSLTNMTSQINERVLILVNNKGVISQVVMYLSDSAILVLSL